MVFRLNIQSWGFNTSVLRILFELSDVRLLSIEHSTVRILGRALSYSVYVYPTVEGTNSPLPGPPVRIL